MTDNRCWIIEGTPVHGIELRAEKADIIIFLDFNRVVCIYRLIKRALKNIALNKKHGIDGPAKFFSLKAIKWVWRFHGSRKNAILNLLKKEHEKKTFYIKTNDDLQNIVRSLVKLNS